MAIDRMTKVWLISPASQAASLPDQLARSGLVHVCEIAADDERHDQAISRLSVDTRDIDARLRALRETVEVLSEFAPATGDLLSNLIPTPIETTRDELDAALAAVDIDALHAAVRDAAARRAAARGAIEQADERLARLGAFGGYTTQVLAEGDLRWTAASVWLAPAKQVSRVLELGLGPAEATLEVVGTADNRTLVAAASLREDAADVATRLRNLGFEALPPMARSTPLDSYVQAIEAERQKNQQALDTAVAELAELGRQRHAAELVLGHWEEAAATRQAVSKMAATGRVAVLMGYVRERQLDAFQSTVAAELPQVSMVAEEPTGTDNVPVALRNSSLVRPASFLVEMFGLPHYSQFDPSAFLFLSFVLFFGICLGDAIYGIALFAMCWALIKRYRNYPGIRSLFELLAWGAVATFIVGVISGTWAADLFLEYLGKDSAGNANGFGRFFGSFQTMDMLGKPLVALSIALFLGIANQFWGICMKMHGCWRQGDKWGAFFDGGLWLILLPGIVMLIMVFFSPDLPPIVSQLGATLSIVGAVGLVLTQGRKEATLVGKAVTGLVSLYGIVGSYGAVAFIGDTLSYSRLLALGLTTAIVGSAVNIIANMLNVGPTIVGILLFAALATAGHIFNLLISGLGAFIHSARLIFVEFFGRFYEPGAVRFAPLGAAGGRIRVMD
ncbi:hypothetical protein HQ576_08280 [bacterium]|nr:hypothetical protein [bacterium]